MSTNNSTVTKRITYSETTSDRLKEVKTALRIKHKNNITEEEIVLKYLERGLLKDEKRLGLLKK